MSLETIMFDMVMVSTYSLVMCLHRFIRFRVGKTFIVLMVFLRNGICHTKVVKKEIINLMSTSNFRNVFSFLDAYTKVTM